MGVVILRPFMTVSRTKPHVPLHTSRVRFYTMCEKENILQIKMQSKDSYVRYSTSVKMREYSHYHRIK